MDWIRELCELYDKNQDKVGKIEYIIRTEKKGSKQIPLILLPLFHTTVTAQITVEINVEGEFLFAEKVAKEDKLTVIPITEASGSRTLGMNAHPLCDNLKYLAGDYMQYVSDKDVTKNYESYIEALEKWNSSEYTHKKVKAIYKYLRKGTLIHDLIQAEVLVLDENEKLSRDEKIQNIVQTEAFVRFRVIEKNDITQNFLENNTEESYSECWLDTTLQEAYISYYRSGMKKRDLCYLTGEVGAVTYLHPKKIRNEGDGAKLFSSNDKSNFTFRGRFSNKEKAVAIGYENSQKIHNALKWIIRKQGNYWNGLCIVVWESNLQDIPDWSKDTDSICDEYEGWDDEEKEEKYVGTGEIFASRFKKAMQGYGKIGLNHLDSKVVMLAFDAATTGRLAMIENSVFSLERYIENIQYWHESNQWLQSKMKSGKKFSYMGICGMKEIADALYGTERNEILTIGENSKMYAEVCKRLLPCISNRKKIPLDMVNLAIQKASSPVSYEKRYNWEKILSIACSFVKKQRFEMYKEECWDMEVNDVSTNRDYLYGRLLAVADRIEYRTYDGENDGKRITNAKRYMNAFSQHPYQTWKILEEQIQPYLQKINLVERNIYNKILDEIYHLFKPEDFASNKRLEGVYLLGFHSQSYAFKYKEKSKEEN